MKLKLTLVTTLVMLPHTLKELIIDSDKMTSTTLLGLARASEIRQLTNLELKGNYHLMKNTVGSLISAAQPNLWTANRKISIAAVVVST
jgi:hypothetical protein